MKYAIFGGSFDPPHKGHLEVAKAVKDGLQLDEVIFVPNNRNPLKARAFASSKDRLEMTTLLVEDEDGLSISDIETARPGRSFAVDTIEEFTFARPGELWLVIGTDALLHFLDWKKPEKIVKLCRLAVVGRPGLDPQKAMSGLPHWVTEKIDPVEMKPNKASSTLVREEIKNGGLPEIWLTPRVWEYINERGLYRQEA